MNNRDVVFTIGAFLKAEKVKINNIEQWRWIVVGFEDDTYFDGELINPVEYAEQFEDLIIKEEN